MALKPSEKLLIKNTGLNWQKTAKNISCKANSKKNSDLFFQIEMKDCFKEPKIIFLDDIFMFGSNIGHFHQIQRIFLHKEVLC